MSIETKRNVQNTHKIKLTHEDILEMVRAKYAEISGEVITANVFFSVPRGGDYSGMDVEIDEENVINVVVTTQGE